MDTISFIPLALECSKCLKVSSTSHDLTSFPEKLIHASLEGTMAFFKSLEENVDLDPEVFIKFILKHKVEPRLIRKYELDYKKKQ
jgi:hypothetical protein